MDQIRGGVIKKVITLLLILISCITLAIGLSACDGCGKEETERHKHNYVPTVTEPTCTAKGHTTYNCECGQRYVSDYTDPLGHDYDGDICRRCGWIRHDHIYEKTTVEPTCTEGGFTRGVCSICGASFNSDFTDPLGHDYDNGICRRCDYFNPDEHVHVRSAESTVEATCTEGGYTSGLCSACGNTYTRDYTDPLGHDFVDGKCTRCSALEPTDGLEFRISVSMEDEYYTCVGIGTATELNIVIPSEYNGSPVKAIGDSAFSNKRDILSVIIPDTVTSIGAEAFYYCTSLKSITIPDSVTRVGKDAFSFCRSLESASTPIAGENMFTYCEELKDVDLRGVKTIGKYAFQRCESLKSITIPSSVTSISAFAFLNSSGLEEVKIDDLSKWCEISFENEYSNPLSSAQVYGKSTRLYVKGEYNKKLTIPDGATSVSDFAFYGYINVSEITLPDSVTRIGESAFSGCSQLLNINIPSKVTSIGKEAFKNCRNLISIAISDGVKEICDGTFGGCTALSSVTLPDSVTSIGNSTFSDCKSLKSIKLPDCITSISDELFWGCTALEKITIPDGVTVIGIEAFSRCESLTDIIIPEGVKRIESYAFEHCTKLTTATLPASVSYVWCTFAYCYNLTEIFYGGTVKQWEKLTKNSSINYYTGKITVHCSNGDTTVN